MILWELLRTFPCTVCRIITLTARGESLDVSGSSPSSRTRLNANRLIRVSLSIQITVAGQELPSETNWTNAAPVLRSYAVVREITIRRHQSSRDGLSVGVLHGVSPMSSPDSVIVI